MFKSVRIQNFRQFKDLELKNLGRINLITGQNNTGKTSLLEALLLHVSPTNPEIVLTVAQLREIEKVLAEGPNSWGWIFRDSADSEVITIESQDTMNNRLTQKVMTSRSLQIPQTNFPVSSSAPGTYEPVITTSGRPLHSLTSEFRDLQGNRGTSRIRLDGGSTTVEHLEGNFTFKRWYLATKPESPVEAAQIYSRVVLAGREDDIVEALRVLDPRLERLRVLDSGTGPSVHADFGDGRFLPVNVAGRGFSRLLSMVSIMIDTAGGLVLIDEIEDGLHYSALPAVWKAIIAAAHKHDVQIFATTHSLEAIEAAVEGSEGYEGSLAFYRLERRDGDIKVVMGEDNRLRSAVKVGTELR